MVYEVTTCHFPLSQLREAQGANDCKKSSLLPPFRALTSDPTLWGRHRFWVALVLGSLSCQGIPLRTSLGPPRRHSYQTCFSSLLICSSHVSQVTAALLSDGLAANSMKLESYKGWISCKRIFIRKKSFFFFFYSSALSCGVSHISPGEVRTLWRAVSRAGCLGSGLCGMMVLLAGDHLSPGLSWSLLLSFAARDPAQLCGCLSPEKEESFCDWISLFLSSQGWRGVESSSFNNDFSS